MKTGKAKKAIYSVVALGMLLVAPQAMAASSSVEDANLAELKQLIMEQQRQIAAQDKAIRALQGDQAKQAAMAQSNGVVSPLGKLVNKGNDKVSLSLYGQVNRAVMFADDGEESEVYHVDNDNSSTRIGLKGSAKANDDLTAGFKFEVEFEGNSSSKVTQGAESATPEFLQRHMDVYLQSKQFGKLSIGQGDTASNGTSEVDLSGTTVIGYSDQKKLGTALEFYDNRENGGAGGYSDETTINSVMSNMDGLSRRDRLRYDTPTWNGFSAATSTVEKNGNDVALRYSGKIGSAKLAGAVAYARMGDNDSDVDTTINGSVSVLLANGFNATFAAGSQDLDEPAAGYDDPTFMYGKLGYIAKIFDVGTTAFAVDYGMYDDVRLKGDEADSFGIMAVQKLNDWGTEFYASYRVFSLDRTATDLEDINVGMAGARIKF